MLECGLEAFAGSPSLRLMSTCLRGIDRRVSATEFRLSQQTNIANRKRTWIKNAFNVAA
jgi:hypothetical protein